MAGNAPGVEPDFLATIPAMLHAVADRFADNDAIVAGDTSLTYRELEAHSAEMAMGLLAMNVGKGDRVGILLPNGPDYAVVFMAITRIGAVAAPLSTLYQAAELQWVLGHAAISCLITAPQFRNHDYLARLEAALPGLAEQSAGAIAVPAAPFLRNVLVMGNNDRSWAEPLTGAIAGAKAARPEFNQAFLAAVEAQVRPSDPACVIHTSGSTANPKGVVHGHGPFIRHTYQMAISYTPLSQGDRVIGLRPFFWVAGLIAQLFYCWQAGACHVTIDSPSDATVLHAIDHHGVNVIAGDESWFQKLRYSSQLLDAGYEVFELSNEFCGVAQPDANGKMRFLSENLAAKIPEPVHHHTDRFAWTFGMTEFQGAHTSSPWNVHGPSDRPRSSGRLIPGVEARVCDPKSHEILPPNTPGELEVRGYSMMVSMDGREMRDVLTNDGFYRTDDLTVIDDDGYITLIGRLGDGFKVKGANLAPLEVEMALLEFNAIELCCVVGVPLDQHRTDHTVVAVVHPRKQAQIDAVAIKSELKTRLSSYKVPDHIMVFALEDIPITGSGKIKRSELLAKVTQRLAL